MLSRSLRVGLFMSVLFLLIYEPISPLYYTWVVIGVVVAAAAAAAAAASAAVVAKVVGGGKGVMVL